MGMGAWRAGWAGIGPDDRQEWSEDDAVREGAALDSEDTAYPESPSGLTTVSKPGPQSLR